jgi:hypothetical protein
LAKYVYHCFDKRNHNEITIIWKPTKEKSLKRN